MCLVFAWWSSACMPQFCWALAFSMFFKTATRDITLDLSSNGTRLTAGLQYASCWHSYPNGLSLPFQNSSNQQNDGRHPQGASSSDKLPDLRRPCSPSSIRWDCSTKNKTARLSLTACLPDEMSAGQSSVFKEDDSSCFLLQNQAAYLIL